MKKQEFFSRIPENAVFWMVLFFFAVGAATSLYGKAAGRSQAADSGRVLSPVSSVHNEAGTSLPAGDAHRKNHTVKERELPIYCVQTEKPQVALSFDAAWGNEDTKTILDILEKYQVKATFFMTGGWVEKYPEDVKSIASLGHDLGNHSENHKNMSTLSKKEIRSEIETVHERVKELTGQEMCLFRPPYGDYDDLVISTALDLNYYPIEWDCDSLDWKDYGTDSIIDTVVNHKHLGNGSIILMHNGAKYTPGALEAVITGIQEKGYELVPVSRLIYGDQYHLDQEGRQIKD